MLKLQSAPVALVDAQQRVESALYHYSKSESRAINEGIESLLKAGGKRVRALLCLIGQFYGTRAMDKPMDPGAIEVACMPEMLHLASLIHDDIIDQADSRRGVQTLHRRFGADVAVYAGDYVILDTLNRLYEYFAPEVQKDFSEDLLGLVRSEISQMAGRKTYNPSLKRYLRIVEGKTARLLMMSLKMGLVYGGASQENTKKLVAIVHDLGMAFQIVDDCLDFTGSPNALGKPVLSDLKYGYMTLPAILRAKSEPQFLKKLQESGGPRPTKAVVKDFAPYVAQAMAVAERMTRRALTRLSDLEAREPHPMNGVMQELIEQLLVRKN